MAEDSRDVLMKLVPPSGKFEAECTAVVPNDDPLSNDFIGTHQIGSLVRGNYFAIEDFTFDMGLADKPKGTGGEGGGTSGAEESAAHTATQVNQARVETHRAISALHDDHDALHQRVVELEEQLAEMAGHMASMAREAGRAGRDAGRLTPRAGARAGSSGRGGVSRPNVRESTPPNSGTTVAFQRFMTEGRAGVRKGDERYPSDLQPISITKGMDISSRQLFDCCQTSTLFKAATIIKRKAVGAATLRTYLRLDFTDVLLIRLNWEDDDVIKETFQFVCRSAKVQYSLEAPTTGTNSTGASSILKLQDPASWTALGSGAAS